MEEKYKWFSIIYMHMYCKKIKILCSEYANYLLV